MNKKPTELGETLRKTFVAGGILGISAILQFTFNVVVSNKLGADIAGVFFIAFNITMFLAIVAQLGMDLSLVRLISPLWAKKKYQSIRRLTGSASLLAAASASVIALATALLAPLIANEIFNDARVTQALKITSIAMLPLTLSLVYTAILRAQKQTASSLFVKHIAFYTPAIILAFLIGDNIENTSYAFIVGATVAAILGGALFTYHHRGKESSEKKIRTESMLGLVRLSMPFLIIVLSARLMNWLDTFMIGAIKDSASVALYNAGLQVSIGISLVLVAFNTIGAAQFSELYGLKKMNELKNLYVKITRIVLAISIPLTTLVIVFSAPILSLFGEEFSEARTALIILAIGQLINVGAGSVGYLESMSGGEKRLARVTVAVNLLNIALNLIMIPRYGINGAAIATASSLAVKNIVLAYGVRKRLGVSII